MQTVNAHAVITTSSKDRKERIFYIIVSGTVFAKYGKHTTILSKGDVVGIFDINMPESFHQYIAASSVELIPYGYKPGESLLNLLNENADLCKILLNSINNHICEVIGSYDTAFITAKDLYDYVSLTRSRYLTTCKIFNMTPRPLPFEGNLPNYSFECKIAPWLMEYYENLCAILKDSQNIPEAPFVYGYLEKTCADIKAVRANVNILEEQASLFASYILGNDYNDFYDLYCDLYIKTQANGGDTSAISNVLSVMTDKINTLDYINQELIDKRVTAFKSQSITSGANVKSDVDITIMHAKLAGALNEILEFSDTVAATATEFRRCIDQFKVTSDKEGSDENTTQLRHTITKLFNIIYTDAMQNALKMSDIPTVIKMFLNFGFVDTDVAGYDNAVELYKLVNSFKGSPKDGIYTPIEWFQAILNGEKQPSKDEFERDYPQFVRSLISEGKITKAAEKAMLEDCSEKVLFELNNMFPTANKITFGRVFTFCPVLMEENMIRQPNALMVTPIKLLDNLAKINEIDYSLFYHEYLFEEYKLNIKDLINVDIKPDIVLMPNIGNRGVMWQEIEGPSRRTPARFFISAFFVENMEKCMMRLAAEYRWEMCKRDMGARWNDVTTHCLTAEYSDYIQFVSKNRDLSTDSKDKVKESLKRCRNSYKEMFVNDYIQHITYEIHGSCRLNKVARGLLFNFCPPAKEYREKLEGNSIYEEALRKNHIATAQALHRIDVMETKYSSSTIPFPKELSSQRELLNK